MIQTVENIGEKLVSMLTYDASQPLIFSSGLFLFLFAGFLFFYGFTRRAPMARIVYVILFSLYFYYKSSGIYFLLLVFASVSDYWIAHAIYKVRTQMDQMGDNLEAMQKNVQLVRQRKEKLNIRSTISGEIGLLDVELGQSIQAGQKIGVINDLSDFKVQAQVDEHYIDRVKPGLTATFDQNGKHYLLQVRKVYPEVRDGRFRIDFVFKGVRPGNIRTGQTYYVDLQLGQSKQAIIIPKGTFYSVTGGQWIFVLDKSGKKAYRRKITIGRQNPQYYEVIEGLEPGEQVIVSGYEAYKDNEILMLN